MGDVVIIGGGPAALMAAMAICRSGRRPRILAKGWGTLFWHAGCIDVIGTDRDGTPVDSPREAVEDLVASNPRHPYAMAGGLPTVELALEVMMELCAAAGYPLVGTLDRNWNLPTALGGLRPTCLAPVTMIGGTLERRDPVLAVGFCGFSDFTPALFADNMSQLGTPCRGTTVILPSLQGLRNINGVVLATAFDQPDFRHEVIELVRPQLGSATRVAFPAVLGLNDAGEAVAHLRAGLGVDVFEVPVIPPSIPGMRLHRILLDAIKTQGGRVFDGMEAIGFEAEGDRVVCVMTAAAARAHRTGGDCFVLATGGILGGGIVGDEDGSLRELVFDLPVVGPRDRSEWLSGRFTDPSGHPVFESGVVVDEHLRPVDRSGEAVFRNLVAAGTIIAGTDPIRERSVDGIGLATGWSAGTSALTVVDRAPA